MIVGESHYYRQDEAPPIGLDFIQATISVAEDRIDSGFHGSFFSSPEAIVGGNKLGDQAARVAFWNDKAFMNFIDRHVMEGSTPTHEDFVRSSRAFFADISDLKPDLICLFSKRSWDARPWGQAPWDEVLGAEPEEISEYATYYPAHEDSGCLIARFNHPRNLGRPVSFWQEKFAEAKAAATSRRRPRS
jgi:hypothetical protein